MVYVLNIDEIDPSFCDGAISLLPFEKQKRYKNIKNPNAKKETALAWLLLRYALSKHGCGSMPSVAFAEHGKPYFEGGEIGFNLSHSGSMVCAALNFAGDIGTDIQKKSCFSEKVKERVFSKNELLLAEDFEDDSAFFTRLWALKESFLKYTGTGIAYDIKSLDFSSNFNEPFFEKEGLYYSVFSLEEYALSVCSASSEPEKLSFVSLSQIKSLLNI